MSDNVALSWNRAALEAVRQTRMGPPIVARALHVLHAAMYDAWAAHDELTFGSRLGDRLRRPPADRTQEARREAASFAAHRALVDQFPSEATAFAKLMNELAGRGRGPSGARSGSPTSPPRRSRSTSRATPPSAPPRPRCWPASPGPTASG
jgi:hypothetical protein